MRINEVILNERPFTNKLGSVKRLQGVVPNVTTNPVTAQKVVFKGPKAKTWDQDAADTAQALEDAGVDADEIWKQTGTFRNPNGSWRQEISDYAMEFKPGTVEFDTEKKMSDVIDHPELYKAYPHLKDMTLEIQTPDTAYKRGYAGYFDPGNKKIVISMDPEWAELLNDGLDAWKEDGYTEEEWKEMQGALSTGLPKPVMAHELTHAVQDKEQPDYWQSLKWDLPLPDNGELPSNYNTISIERDALMKQLKDKGFKDKYHVPGPERTKTWYDFDSDEVEARSPQRRAGMHPDMAKDIAPNFGDTKVIHTKVGGDNTHLQKELPGPTYAQTPSARSSSTVTHQVKNNPWNKGNK